MPYKVTVLIPCFNSDRFLKTTIESVKNQSIGFENIELILIDDFSTDSTPEIIEDYVKHYENIISYSLNEKAGAPGTARNMGIANAQGKYIMFMDHDDKYPQNAIKTLYQEIESIQKNKKLAIGRYKTFGDANWVSDMWMENNNHDPITIDRLSENTNFITINNIWRMIFPVKFLREENIYFPEKIFAEDLAFMIESFLKAEKISFTKDIVYFFRTQNTDNSSTSYSKSIHYIGKLLDGYYYTKDILLNNNACKYYDLLFSMHLSSWIANLIESTTIQDNEKYQLLKKAEPLFNNLKTIELDINPDFEKYRKIIEYLIEGKTENAYKILKKLENNEKIANSKSIKSKISNRTKNIIGKIKKK